VENVVMLDGDAASEVSKSLDIGGGGRALVVPKLVPGLLLPVVPKLESGMLLLVALKMASCMRLLVVL
jgi:hypothetical protein